MQMELCVFLMGELLRQFSFCFLYSGEQHPQTRTKTKKRWVRVWWCCSPETAKYPLPA